MWLVFDPATETIVERDFPDDQQAVAWVAKQVEDGVVDAKHWLVCPDVEGFNE